MFNAQHFIAPTVGFDKHFAYAQAIQAIHGYFAGAIVILFSIIILLILIRNVPREAIKGEYIGLTVFACALIVITLCCFVSISHDTTYARLNNTLTTTNHNVIKEYKLSSNFSDKKEYVYREYNKQGKRIGQQYVSHKQIMPSDNIFAFGDK